MLLRAPQPTPCWVFEVATDDYVMALTVEGRLTVGYAVLAAEVKCINLYSRLASNKHDAETKSKVASGLTQSGARSAMA